MISVRNLNQQVKLTVQTVATTHPADTVGDHWYWEVLTADGVAMQQQTAEPTVTLSLPPNDYAVSVQLETVDGVMVGGQATGAFTIEAPDVVIQTAGTLTVEMV